MISAKQLYSKRSKTEGRTFLKYSDLPFGTRLLTVRVIAIRETPRLNSPCVLDIENAAFVDGKALTLYATSIPINLTNLRLMGDKCGDDLTVLNGAEVTFSFSLKSNPNAKGFEDAETMGFDFYDAKLGIKPAPVAPAPAQQPAAAAQPPHAQQQPPKQGTRK